MKNFLITTLFISVMAASWAQEGLHIGAIFMPQGTWLLNEDLDGGEFTFGTAYGASANIHFGDKWGVGAQILFSNEGQKFSHDTIQNVIEVSYLKIPLLLHFNSDPNNSTPFLAEVGIQFSTLTKAKHTVNGEEITDENGDPINAKDLFNSSNLGGVLAFGPGFLIGDHIMLTVMARVDIQFQDAFSQDFNVVLDGSRKETYPMTVGLKFGLKYMIGKGAGYE